MKRRRSLKDCHHDGKPSWRDLEAARWGANKHYRGWGHYVREQGLSRSARPDPLWAYVCRSGEGHYHLTTQPQDEPEHEFPVPEGLTW